MPQPIPSAEGGPETGTAVPSDDLAAVCEIAECASRASTPDELFAAALDRFLQLTQMEMGGVVLLDPAGRFDLRVQRRLPEAVLSQIQGAVPPKQSVPALAIEQCQLMVVHDAAADPRELAAWQQLGLRTHVCIPLQVGRRALGLLGLMSDQEHRFSRQRREMFTAAGAVIGLAIEEARALEGAARRAEQLVLSLREAHHRIKNNLQAVSALIDLQLAGASPHLPREALERTVDRINSIALVHDFLSHDTDLRMVAARPLLEKLVPVAVEIGAGSNPEIAVVLEIDDALLPSKTATAIAMVTGELVSNAVKHGLRDRTRGTVTVSLHAQEAAFCLSVADDGAGLPRDFAPQRDGHLGLEITRRLVERDLGGTLRYLQGTGTRAEVRWARSNNQQPDVPGAAAPGNRAGVPTGGKP
jgi:two-component sensor histidine kinase